eukprot:Clim_evm83s153 gene=Clim_evmTU83s153
MDRMANLAKEAVEDSPTFRAALKGYAAVLQNRGGAMYAIYDLAQEQTKVSQMFSTAQKRYSDEMDSIMVPGAEWEKPLLRLKENSMVRSDLEVKFALERRKLAENSKLQLRNETLPKAKAAWRQFDKADKQAIEDLKACWIADKKVTDYTGLESTAKQSENKYRMKSVNLVQHIHAAMQDSEVAILDAFIALAETEVHYCSELLKRRDEMAIVVEELQKAKQKCIERTEKEAGILAATKQELTAQIESGASNSHQKSDPREVFRGYLNINTGTAKKPRWARRFFTIADGTLYSQRRAVAQANFRTRISRMEDQMHAALEDPVYTSLGNKAATPTVVPPQSVPDVAEETQSSSQPNVHDPDPGDEPWNVPNMRRASVMENGPSILRDDEENDLPVSVSESYATEDDNDHPDHDAGSLSQQSNLSDSPEGDEFTNDDDLAPLRPLGTLQLCTVKPLEHTVRRNCFQLVWPNQTIELQADSTSDFNLWVQRLQAGILSALDQFHDGTQREVKADPELIKVVKNAPGNDKCVDCGQPNPEWASLNLGALMCIECSGAHRQVGTHVSKVRSFALDRWSDATLRMLADLGNTIVNRSYWANPPEPVPSDRPALVKSKYADRVGLGTWELTDSPNNTLRLAVQQNNLELAHVSVAHNADVNSSVDHGTTLLLHEAARNGFEKMCHFLVWNGADLEATDAAGLKPYEHMPSLVVLKTGSTAPVVARRSPSDVSAGKPAPVTVGTIPGGNEALVDAAEKDSDGAVKEQLFVPSKSLSPANLDYLPCEGPVELRVKNKWKQVWLVSRDGCLFVFKKKPKGTWNEAVAQKSKFQLCCLPKDDPSTKVIEKGRVRDESLAFRINGQGSVSWFFRAANQSSLDAWAQHFAMLEANS